MKGICVGGGGGRRRGWKRESGEASIRRIIKLTSTTIFPEWNGGKWGKCHFALTVCTVLALSRSIFFTKRVALFLELPIIEGYFLLSNLRDSSAHCFSSWERRHLAIGAKKRNERTTRHRCKQQFPPSPCFHPFSFPLKMFVFVPRVPPRSSSSSSSSSLKHSRNKVPSFNSSSCSFLALSAAVQVSMNGNRTCLCVLLLVRPEKVRDSPP